MEAKNYVHLALSKLRFEKLAPILKEIGQFNYSIIKGEALSVQAYGITGCRFSSDIDILISRKHMSDVENILKLYGFDNISYSRRKKITLLTTSHQTIPWFKEFDKLGALTVDINYDIFWGEYEGVRLDLDTFLSDAVEIDIYGIKTKVLPPIKALIQLVLHHYKDMNSLFLLATRNSITYDMFKDVYHLLKNNTDRILLDELYKMSCEYSIVPYVYYILYYTGQIYDDPLIKKYVDAFETPYGRELLNCYGLCEREKKEWRFDFKTRLETENLYDLIKKDLSEKDIEKISINKQFF